MMPAQETRPAGDVPQALDVMSFPLRGSHLIEASAGTGKTFTISSLYVRLVLGHAGDGLDLTARIPPEILVVTFTEAATKELRDRIRARLAQAAAYFQGGPQAAGQAESIDDTLLALGKAYEPADWPHCARTLALAANWMDESAVSTIHSWCNRMLREHAFDSESLFSQSFDLNLDPMVAEATADYWRTFVVNLGREDAATLLGWWSSPPVLNKQVKRLLAFADQWQEQRCPAELLPAARTDREAVLRQLKASVADWVPGFRRIVEEIGARALGKPRSFRPNDFANWFAKLEVWAAGPGEDLQGMTPTAWLRLSVQGLREVLAQPDAAHPFLQDPALQAAANLRAALAALPDAKPAILRHAAAWIAARVDAAKLQRSVMGPDDVLRRLRDALRGPNGPRLGEAIRRQFPVAFIDEFQDTDPIQYAIFDAVYRIAENDASTSIVLIGDPKQAIYSFRGADIYAYLQARRACAGRLQTLSVNYRSTNAVVEATNHVFALAETRQDRGAFMFGSGQEQPVPFSAARASPRNDVFLVEGTAQPALTVWTLPDPPAGQKWVAGTSRERMGGACAAQVVHLLNLASRARSAIRAGDPMVERPLRPADIAILVNSRPEAAVVRKALARRGVRSVYLSDQDSVYDSGQARDLLLWLRACARPEDGASIRAALASASLGRSWDWLDQLNQDEAAWEVEVQRFHGYRQIWRSQGVLPMLRRMLHDFDVPAALLKDPADARLLAGSDSGERALTNLLHLAELLQRASDSLEREHALIRFLAEQIDSGGAGDDANSKQIRLESDADIVQVVTVHKSKGLEYPLVFLPFGCYVRSVDAKDLPVKWHDGPDALQLSLDPSPDDLRRADVERRAEDIRKLYVGLTRAKYATWLGLAPADRLEDSALGYLIGPDSMGTPQAMASGVAALWGTCPHIRIAVAEEPEQVRLVASQAATQVGPVMTTDRVRRARWWIASYSALSKPDAAENAALDATEGADAANFAELIAVGEDGDALAGQGVPTLGAADTAPAVAGGDASIHRFHAGAEAGTFLHDLLQWAAERGFGNVVADRTTLRDTIARRCAIRRWEAWVDPLTDWIIRLLDRPLQLPAQNGFAPASLRLADIAAARAEMEFWVGVGQVGLGEIDALVCRHTLGGEARPRLAPSQLNGMLKGFMDLVFEHEGRFYVADYKSNRLGQDASAYTTGAIREAILHSRYDLQYVLYLLALHRLLRSRLPDYDYDRHMGGAVYLFLRGVDSATQGVHVERPSRTLIDRLDAMFAGPGTAPAGVQEAGA